MNRESDRGKIISDAAGSDIAERLPLRSRTHLKRLTPVEESSKQKCVKTLTAESPSVARLKSVFAGYRKVLGGGKPIVYCEADPCFNEEEQQILIKEEQEIHKKEEQQIHKEDDEILEEEEELLLTLGNEIVCHVVVDGDLFRMFGTNLVDLEDVLVFGLHPWASLKTFKKKIAKQLGVPVKCQRIWLGAEGESHAYRPRRCVEVEDEELSLWQLREHNMFLEVQLDKNGRPTSLPKKTPGDILLFFKYYDPTSELLKYVGRLFVNGSGSPADILQDLNAMAGLSGNVQIDLYNCRCDYTCCAIQNDMTFRDSGLKDGDMVCFQRSVADSVEIEGCVPHPNFPTFLESLRNCKHIRFHSLKEPQKDILTLALPLTQTCDEVLRKVAMCLSVHDPKNVRLTSPGHYCEPRTLPIKIGSVNNLSDMLQNYDKHSHDMLYYEVLETSQPEPELKNLRALKIRFEKGRDDKVYLLNVPEEATVQDVLDNLKEQAGQCSGDGSFVLFWTSCAMIRTVFKNSEKINMIPYHGTLRADVVEFSGSDCHFLHVSHFCEDSETSWPMPFGVPFLLAIKEDDELSVVKERIKDKLQVKDDEFSKWTFACLSGGPARYICESDVVFAYYFYGASWRFMKDHCVRGSGAVHLDLGPVHLGIHHSDDDIDE